MLRFRSPLLAESLLLSSPRGTEMFHFPRFAPLSLWIQLKVRRHYPPWVSPFGHSRIKACLAAPRDFSQLATSFLASCRPGIHRVPLVAWSSLFFRPLLRAFRFAKTKVQRGAVNHHASHINFLPTCAYAVFKERNLVEPIGFEPTTSSLQSWRSPS